MACGGVYCSLLTKSPEKFRVSTLDLVWVNPQYNNSLKYGNHRALIYLK